MRTDLRRFPGKAVTHLNCTFEHLKRHTRYYCKFRNMIIEFDGLKASRTPSACER